MSNIRQSQTMSAPLGALECALFMKQGIPRFQGDLPSMLKSFLVPLAVLPLSFIGLYYSQGQRPELAGITYEYLAVLFLLKQILVMALGIGLIYAFAKAYERTDRFYLTITAGNWAGIFPTLIFLPALYCLSMGWYSWEEIYPGTVVLSVYGYVLGAFVLKHALQIPWEMAGFLVICGMAINETGFHALYWLAS